MVRRESRRWAVGCASLPGGRGSTGISAEPTLPTAYLLPVDGLNYSQLQAKPVMAETLSAKPPRFLKASACLSSPRISFLGMVAITLTHRQARRLLLVPGGYQQSSINVRGSVYHILCLLAANAL